jgi:broad specificity phosphatase PhoE
MVRRLSGERPSFIAERPAVAVPDHEVWLVRHGETEWSRDHRHTSMTDLPLTDVGEDVARGLAARLKEVNFGLVLTSPRLRARRSAELAGFGDASIEDDLTEWNYGDFEGITTAAIRESVAGWTVWTHPCPGGESVEEVQIRLDRVIARIKDHETDGGGPALLFGHGHALRALTARWLGLDVSEGRLFRLDTATVSVLGYEREVPVIVRWNG